MLNDIKNWSKDIFLRVGIWKSKDPPLIRSEVTVGSSILIHVLTLTCLPPPPPPLMFRAHR